MKPPRLRLLVINDPQRMRIVRELADEIGFNESVVFLQLEFLIGTSQHVRDGMYWTYRSLRELHEDHFSWWSQATLSRIIRSLEERELIHVRNYNKLPADRTQWYALNEIGIARLTSVRYETSTFQNETSILQDDSMDDRKMKSAIPKTPTKNQGGREEPDPHAKYRRSAAHAGYLAQEQDV